MIVPAVEKAVVVLTVPETVIIGVETHTGDSNKYTPTQVLVIIAVGTH